MFVRRRGSHIFLYVTLIGRTECGSSIRLIENSNDLIGNRIRDLPVCSIVLQPTTLLRAPKKNKYSFK
jgi:hypothetical protein